MGHVNGEGRLGLVKMDQKGKCGSECRAVRAACKRVWKASGKLVSMMLADSEAQSVVDELCRASCRLKLPALDNFVDKAFEPLSVKESGKASTMDWIKSLTGKDVDASVLDDVGKQSKKGPEL